MVLLYFIIGTVVFMIARDPFILLSISVQADRELYLQILGDFVKICLAGFV